MKAVSSKIEVEVVSVTDLARNIKRFDLARRDRALLPDAPAGAHVMLNMAEGLGRYYSLLTSGTSLPTYAIAVKLERGGAGGSHFMHTQVSEGTILSIDEPSSSFPLAAEGGMSIFLAGGIGITPIWSMIEECERRSRPWKLFYAANSRKAAAFADRLEGSPHVQLFFSAEQGARLDIAAVVRNAPSDAHLYCCGPTRMIADFQKATSEFPSSQVHIESFAPLQVSEESQPITIELARSNKTIHVPADKSILEILLKAGVRVPFSCRQGACGSCEVEVLAGCPDHRDKILSDVERASNKTIITCCSRSQNGHLVLNL